MNENLIEKNMGYSGVKASPPQNEKVAENELLHRLK
jgi:hypothetical protein